MLKKCEPFDRGLNGSFSHIKRFFILHIKSLEKGVEKGLKVLTNAILKSTIMDIKSFKKRENGSLVFLCG